MNVLIFGAAGFLGVNLVRRVLREAGARITAVDSLDPKFSSTLESLRDVMDRIEFVQSDIRDASRMGDLVRGRDVIFSCAGQSSHALSLRDPLLDASINCLGNLTLLEAVRAAAPQATVVYPSSTTMMGRSAPVDSDSPEMPLDIYSADKGVAEKYYRIYHHVHGLKTVVLRFPNLYGPYGKSSPDFGFVNHFIHTAANNGTIRIFGDGRQIRNILHADDAVEAMWTAARHSALYGKSSIVAGREHRSVLDIAREIVRVFERGRIEHVEWPPERERIEIHDARYVSGSFEELTGWMPALPLRDGLERTRRAMGA